MFTVFDPLNQFPTEVKKRLLSLVNTDETVNQMMQLQYNLKDLQAKSSKRLDYQEVDELLNQVA